MPSMKIDQIIVDLRNELRDMTGNNDKATVFTKEISYMVKKFLVDMKYF